MRLFIGLVVALALPSLAARADETKSPQPAPERSRPERIHTGSASVTVVDEHDAVDDVISRIRSGKPAPTVEKANDAETGDQAPRTGKATNKDRSDARSTLRSQRDRVTERAEAERRKDERRERAANARARMEKKQRR